jgi:C-terminal processing protease CtpA/Prc
MKAAPGEKVIDGGSVYKQDSIYDNPKHISILINDKSLSASELFLIACKQSKKVTIYGESSSGGAGDKLDAYPFSAGCENYLVRIPISKRIGQVYTPAIDNVGIPPDIFIPAGSDPYEFIFSKIKAF